MKPRDRKLRLRRTTLRSLDTETALQALGGALIDTKPSFKYVECVEETRAFTNCEYCASNAQTCPNRGCNTEYPCLPPR